MKGNSAFVGEFSLDRDWLARLDRHHAPTIRPIGLSRWSLAVDGLLGRNETSALVDILERQGWIPVGIDGIKANYTESDRIGSYRASCFEEEFAEVLTTRLAAALPETWSFDGNTTENDPHETWRLVGVNPLFRFIKYAKGGVLVPHYDRSFRYPDGRRRTLVSLVLYLTPVAETGRTRFIADTRAGVPVARRDLSDWTAFPGVDDVVYAHTAGAGDALLFEHCILHDSEDHVAERPKIIARTDLVFVPETG